MSPLVRPVREVMSGPTQIFDVAYVQLKIKSSVH